MTLKNADDSYHRYKQYRVNRYRFRREQVTFPIVMLIIIGIITKFWNLIVLLFIIIILLQVFKFLNGSKKNINNIMEDGGEKMENNYVKESSKMKTLKSTDYGYINKNNQQNKGCSSKPGTDNNQWFYNMSCLHCGHTYYANGSDIWLRKCPNCQGGKK